MEMSHPRRHPSRDWSDKEGSFEYPEDSAEPEDALDRRVRSVLARLDPDAAIVMRVQGRREFDRLAEQRQRRIDARESSHDICDAMPPQDVWRLMGKPRSRAEEIAAANRARPGDWPGREHMTDDEWETWRHRGGLDELLPQQRTDTDVQEATR